MTASLVIVRKISLAVADTTKISPWRFVQGMLNLFRILKVSVRDRRSSKWASRSNGENNVCIYIYWRTADNIHKNQKALMNIVR